MEEIKEIKEDEIEIWLQKHTIKCPLGKVSKWQCENNRKRPKIKDCGEWDLPMPFKCMGCDPRDYFKQKEEVYG